MTVLDLTPTQAAAVGQACLFAISSPGGIFASPEIGQSLYGIMSLLNDMANALNSTPVETRPNDQFLDESGNSYTCSINWVCEYRGEGYCENCLCDINGVHIDD